MAYGTSSELMLYHITDFFACVDPIMKIRNGTKHLTKLLQTLTGCIHFLSENESIKILFSSHENVINLPYSGLARQRKLPP